MVGTGGGQVSKIKKKKKIKKNNQKNQKNQKKDNPHPNPKCAETVRPTTSGDALCVMCTTVS